MRTTRRRMVAVGGIAALLLGCAARPDVTPSASPAGTRQATEATASAVPAMTPLLPLKPLVEEIGVTCGDGAVFPVGRLDDVGAAHRSESPPARALQAFLRSADGISSGASSWILVELTLEHAQFLGRQARDRWSYVRFARREGAWELDIRGECVPAVAIEPGQLAVEWALDGDTRALSGGRSLGLLLDTVPCDPGDAALEYVDPPIVTMREDRIEVAVLAREDRAAQYCKGPFPLRIDLPEPDRGLPVYDGATFPPRLVEAP